MIKHILLVEDDPALQQAFSMILSIKGYDVKIASNGLEALDLIDTKPDLIFLDMLMPRMNGLEFARKANLKKNLPKTRVILFSNLSNSSDQAEIKSLGIHESYLKANITPSQLIDIVEKGSKSK
jgi:CheY-like chemotaxis protein